MIRKPIRIVVKVVAVTFALAAIAIGAVAWRLHLGPIEAEFAARHLRAELARSFPDLTIGLGRTEALWPGELSGLPLRSRDLRLIGKDGGEVAHFPEGRRVDRRRLPCWPGSCGWTRSASCGRRLPWSAMSRAILRCGPVFCGRAGRTGSLRCCSTAFPARPQMPGSRGFSDRSRSWTAALRSSIARRSRYGGAIRCGLRCGAGRTALAGDLSLALGNGKGRARIGGAAVYREEAGRISGTLTFEGLNPAVPRSPFRTPSASSNTCRRRCRAR